METKITEGDGEFVVEARRTFATMGEAQSFVSTFHAGAKVDRRKMRPRAFDKVRGCASREAFAALSLPAEKKRLAAAAWLCDQWPAA